MVSDSMLIIMILVIIVVAAGIIAVFTCMSKGRRSELRLKVGSPKLLVLDVSIKLQ
jgi:flagellar basal body-associated protein FliL